MAVGPAIVFSFEKILRDELKDSLQGKNVLVLGYGSVGRAVANALRGAGAQVMVFDVNPARLIEAKLTGFRVGPKPELVNAADVIFGVSGQQSLNQEDFEYLRTGVYLVSGSSRQIEFNISALEALGHKEKISPSLTKYVLGNKEIILVNEGFPINFRDSSIPMAVADLVFAALLLAFQAVAFKPPGFYPVHSLEGEERILKHWIHCYLNFESKP